MYLQDTNWLTTVPADGLAPNGARPSAGTALTTKLDKFLQMSYAAIENF